MNVEYIIYIFIKERMSNDIYMILIIFAIVLSSLLNVLYNTYGYKAELEQYENFTNYSRNSESTNKINTSSFQEVTDDRPLIKYANLKKTANIDDISEFAYVSSYEFFSVSPNDIFQRISDDISEINIKISEEFVESPVYVIISRTPISSGSNSYKNDIIIGGDTSVTQLYIIYPKYWKKTSNSDENDSISDISKIYKQNGEKGVELFNKYLQNNITSNTNNFGCVLYKVNNHSKIFNYILS